MNKRYRKKPAPPQPTTPAAAAPPRHDTQRPAESGTRRTRNQRLARAALDCVQSAAADANLAGNYMPRAMGFPTLVLQSGLAQAVGFLAAKSGKDGKGKAYQRYFDDLAKVAGYSNGDALLQDALKADLSRYRLLTRDVLDAASWLKRFCQSLIDDKDTGNGE